MIATIEHKEDIKDGLATEKATHATENAITNG